MRMRNCIDSKAWKRKASQSRLCEVRMGRSFDRRMNKVDVPPLEGISRASLMFSLLSLLKV